MREIESWNVNSIKNLSYLVRPNDIVIVDGNIIKEKYELMMFNYQAIRDFAYERYFFYGC